MKMSRYTTQYKRMFTHQLSYNFNSNCGIPACSDQNFTKSLFSDVICNKVCTFIFFLRHETCLKFLHNQTQNLISSLKVIYILAPTSTALLIRSTKELKVLSFVYVYFNTKGSYNMLTFFTVYI